MSEGHRDYRGHMDQPEPLAMDNLPSVGYVDSEGSPVNHRRKKKRRRRPQPVEDENPQLGMDETYTYLQDNPAYETFTEQPSRGSKTKLIESPPRSQKDVQVQSPRSVPDQSQPSFKRVRVDSREKKITGPVNEPVLYMLREATEFFGLSGYRSTQSVKAISEFIKKNIKQRECSRYVRDVKNKKQMCQCGREYDLHSTDRPADMDGREKWKVETHTCLVPADSYGTVNFNGFGQETIAPATYIRVDYKTDMNVMWTLLNDYWDLQPPKLLISVTGGAKKFFLKNRLKNLFKRGLVNAATSTGAWIITGGTNAGVMKFVGEAVHEHMMTTGGSEQNIVALGIATWGIIDNKESLAGEENGQFPADYNIEDLHPDVRGLSALDQNHTHFILVDNGTEKKFGAEIDFRASLTQFISEKMETGVSANQSVHVPVVLLVLEGGPNTLQTAAESVERQIPVVVIQGSGRAADLIAYAYRVTKPQKTDSDESNKPPKFDKEVLERAEYLFEWNQDTQERQTKKKVCLDNINTLLRDRKMVTVFHLDDIDSTKEIDQAILYALLRANKSDAQSQLNLALAWNRCDVARQEIFTVENRSCWQKMNLNDAMFTALVQDRTDFVQLFLDNGVDLKKFLTVRRLRDLYDDVVNDKYAGSSADLLRHLLQQVQQSWLGTLCWCCRSEEWRDDLPNLLYVVGRVINYLTGEQSSNMYSGAALTACALLKALADEADKEEEIDLSNILMQNSEEFEQLAVGTLSECYQRDKSMAHTLLIRELDSWGKTTAFTIADSAEQMDFMGHTSCQTKLNKIWKGKMALYTSYWKILLAMFIPIMIPLIKFSTNETSVEQLPHDGQEEQHVNGEKFSTQNQILPQRSPETKQTPPPKDSSRRQRLTRKLYKVAFLGGGNDNISIFNAIYYFHTAPVTKFFFHTASYLVFLLLFSFFLLTDLHVGTPGVIECVIWGWTATLFTEEFRQVMTRDPRTFSYKMSGYFSSLWNKFDVTMYLMLILSIILRLTLPAEQFTVARIFYALTLSMFFLRFMHTFFVHKQIGPKVIMIRKMMTDLAFFVLILAVFMFSYGVASYVLRFPNTEPRWSLFYEVIYMPYWQLYGELFLEELEGEVSGCTSNRTIWTNNPDVPRCPEQNWVVILLFAVYMILAVILLLNLLIAMFSYTFERVQENSEKVWRYYRYSLIHEYFDRPTLAPPLIIFIHVKRMITYIIRTCKGSPKKSHDFMELLSHEDKKKMTAFERSGMENYLLRSQKLSREHIDAKVTTAGERIDKIIEELEEIKDHIHTGNDGTMKDSSDPKTNLKPASLMPPESSRYDAKEDISLMQSRISGLEQQLEMQAESMSQMLQILRGRAFRPQPQHAFRQVQPTVEIQDMTPPNL